MVDSQRPTSYNRKMKQARQQDAFPERLRKLRLEQNLTQMELGKKTDVSQVYIGRLEKGASQPTADVLKRLANALQVPVGYLLEGDQDGSLLPEDVELSRQFRELQRLPAKDKEIVTTLIDAFLFKRQVQGMAR